VIGEEEYNRIVGQTVGFELGALAGLEPARKRVRGESEE